MSTMIDLPIVIAGQVRMPGPGVEVDEVDYATGVRARIPRLTQADLDAIVSNREDLSKLTVGDVTRYLANAGAAWMNPSYRIRKEAIQQACRITGYSQAMLERDFWAIGDLLQFPNHQYDQLEAEFGTHRILDEWVDRGAVRVKAFPRGRVLHVMVGNVAMASVYSLMRSVLTKNHTVAKLPARDLVTCCAFMRTLIDTNGPDHPISRSLSAAYWEKDSPHWDPIVQACDLVCAWGQGASLRAIKQRIPHSVPFLEFGPKRSFGVVFTNECNVDRAALRIAHDLSVYDQEACFSPQRLFVVGPHEELLARIEHWLSHNAKFLPKGVTGPDIDSHVHRTKLEARFRGADVRDRGEGWSLIVNKDRFTPMEHPLSRTLFVDPIERVEDMLPFLDDETQSVSVFPFKPWAERLAELVCPRGAVRIVETGTVAYPKLGFTHDGSYALHQFVRLAYIDRELNHTFKYGPRKELQFMEQFFYGATAGGVE